MPGFRAASSTATGTSPASPQTTNTITVQQGDCIALRITFKDSVAGTQSSGVTFNGQAMTLLTRQTADSAKLITEDWYLNNANAATAGAVITYSLGTLSRMNMQLVAWSSAQILGGFTAGTGNTGSEVDLSLTISALSWLVIAFSNETNTTDDGATTWKQLTTTERARSGTSASGAANPIQAGIADSNSAPGSGSRTGGALPAASVPYCAVVYELSNVAPSTTHLLACLGAGG